MCRAGFGCQLVHLREREAFDDAGGGRYRAWVRRSQCMIARAPL
jgi:hypothetical protein